MALRRGLLGRCHRTGSPGRGFGRLAAGLSHPHDQHPPHGPHNPYDQAHSRKQIADLLAFVESCVII